MKTRQLITGSTVAVLCGALVYVQYVWQPGAMSAPADLEPSAPPARTFEVADTPKFESFKHISARSLFMQTQTPEVVKPIQTVAETSAVRAQKTTSSAHAEPPASGFRLIGITTEGQASVALVKETANGKSHSLRIGDSINQWKLDAISPRSARFVNGDQTLDLVFEMFDRTDDAPSHTDLVQQAN